MTDVTVGVYRRGKAKVLVITDCMDMLTLDRIHAEQGLGKGVDKIHYDTEEILLLVNDGRVLIKLNKKGG
jgi:hypothetical protein